MSESALMEAIGGKEGLILLFTLQTEKKYKRARKEYIWAFWVIFSRS